MCYFVEHNELLETEEVRKMVGLVVGALFKTQPDCEKAVISDRTAGFTNNSTHRLF